MSGKNWLWLAIGAGALLIFTGKKAYVKMKTYLSRQEFINDFAHSIRSASKGTGLFPSLFMAQAILESSSSKGVPAGSSLAKEGNNLFGIKADKSWKGEVITKRTREVDKNGKEYFIITNFRKYNNPDSSIKDRVSFLLQNKRYFNAGVFNSKTPYEQANALQRAGYATDPLYAKLLANIINKYDLTTLDS